MDAEDANDDAMDMGLIGAMGPSADDFIGDLLLQQLGSSGRSYKREHRAACSRLVSEMYSPRVSPPSSSGRRAGTGICFQASRWILPSTTQMTASRGTSP